MFYTAVKQMEEYDPDKSWKEVAFAMALTLFAVVFGVAGVVVAIMGSINT